MKRRNGPCRATAAALLAAGLAAPLAAADTTWHTDVDEAFQLAAEKDHNLLVDLYAEWCGWCKVLEREVFSSPEFRDLAQGFVLLRVDVEDGGEGSRLNGRFGTGSLPTLLILDPKGVEIGSVAGFAPAAAYVRSIRDELAAHRDLLARYEKGLASGDPELLRALAEELHSRGDGARAAAIYQRVQSLLSEGTPAYAWNRYLLADAYRLDRQLVRAQEVADEAEALALRLGDARLDEQVDLLAYSIAQDRGDCARAIALLESFLDEHPRSLLIRQARRSLDALKSGHVAACA